MNRSFQTILILVTASLSWPVCRAHSQEAEPLYSADRAFRIPFEVDPGDRPRLRDIHLHYSTDRGQSWPQFSSSPPDRADFSFTARADGEYWFTVRTVDLQGTSYPPTPLIRVAPQLRVIVDTTPPEISLRTFNPLSEEVGVEWDITEQHIDIETLRIEFKTIGSADWYPVSAERVRRGSASWKLGIPGPIEIRLRVLDLAKNEGVKSVTISAPSAIPAMTGSDGRRGVPAMPGNGSGFNVPLKPDGDSRNNQTSPYPPSYDDLQPIGPSTAYSDRQSFEEPRRSPVSGIQSMQPPQPSNVKLVNSRFFGINYEIEDQGKSGLGSVELYGLVNGLSWDRWGEDPDKTSPYTVDVNAEGTYGFSLVVKNGAGIGDDPPRPGDPPQIWVEVDLTSPELEFYPPRVGRGGQEGILTIEWAARDRNLDPKGITLSYAESATGVWENIRNDIDNTGRFQWRMPPEVPFKFFLRIQARDKAGNVAERITDSPVIVDLTRPKPKILGVEATDRVP